MKKLENDKGFLIIELSPEEAKSIGFGVPSEGCICMRCNNSIKDNIYYIAVLNDCMCKECFDEWLSTATRYKEDESIEEYNYDNVTYLLEEAAQGNTVEPVYPQIYSMVDLNELIEMFK